MLYLFVVLYIVVLVVISIVTAKKTTTADQFFLGDRNMGAWISAFAYGTTYFSAVIFVGYAGSVGWSNGIWGVVIGIGNAVVGSLLAWLVLAKKTNKITKKFSISTMPEFFEKRYDSKNIKIVSAMIIFIFLVPYCASVYQGLSYLFEIAFNIPFEYCMIGMAILTAFYLFFGGYLATAFVNFFQGIVMIVGVLVMMFYIVTNPAVGGVVEGINRLTAIDPGLTSFNFYSILPVIYMTMLTSLGSWGLPQMVHKFYTIKDEKAIKSGMIISSIFALLMAGSAYFMGAFGRLFLNNTLPIDPLTGLGNTSLVIPIMITTALPAIMVGLVVALVLSASMSTLSSLVLVSASSISMDLIKGVLKPNWEQKKVVFSMRILCVVFVIFSLVVALDKNNAILTLMSYSWGTISGCFLGPFLYGLYWKGVTRAGAWAGILSGLIVTGILMFVIPKEAPLIGCIAMVISLIAVPLVSVFTKKYPEGFAKEIIG